MKTDSPDERVYVHPTSGAFAFALDLSPGTSAVRRFSDASSDHAAVIRFFDAYVEVTSATNYRDDMQMGMDLADGKFDLFEQISFSELEARQTTAPSP